MRAVDQEALWVFWGQYFATSSIVYVPDMKYLRKGMKKGLEEYNNFWWQKNEEALYHKKKVRIIK